MMLYTGSCLALHDNFLYMPTHPLQGVEDGGGGVLVIAWAAKVYGFTIAPHRSKDQAKHSRAKLMQSTGGKAQEGKAQAKHSRQARQGKAQAKRSRQSALGQSTGKVQAKHSRQSTAEETKHSRQSTGKA